MRFSLRALFVMISVAGLVLAGLVNFPVQTALITIWASLTAMAVLALFGISRAMMWFVELRPREPVEWRSDATPPPEEKGDSG